MADLEPRLLLVVGFVVFALALVAVIATHDVRRRKGLVALAAEMGFTYQRDATRLLTGLETFRLLAAGSNRRISNLLQGEVVGTTVWLFDYSYFTGTGRGGRSEYGICLARSHGIVLPHFHLRCRIPGLDRLGPSLAKSGILRASHLVAAAFGGDGFAFPEDDEFGRRFVVTGDEAAVRPLFDEAVRRDLQRFAHTLVRIEADGNTLLYTTGVPLLAKAARETVHQVTDLLALFSRHAAAGHSDRH